MGSVAKKKKDRHMLKSEDLPACEDPVTHSDILVNLDGKHSESGAKKKSDKQALSGDSFLVSDDFVAHSKSAPNPEFTHTKSSAKKKRHKRALRVEGLPASEDFITQSVSAAHAISAESSTTPSMIPATIHGQVVVATITDRSQVEGRRRKDCRHVPET